MRVRVTFNKDGPLRYIGNLDLYTLWERAARRAGLDLAYSHGFHPQPKIHLAAPLPLGFSSRFELLDLRLNEDTSVGDLPARLNAVLPDGVRVLSAQRVQEAGPALQALVRSAEYEITLVGGVPPDLSFKVAALLEAETMPRERRGKRYDLRPLVEEIRLLPAGSEVLAHIWMRLKSQEGATGRPDEVLAALGIRREDARIERTALHLGSVSAVPGTESG